MTDLLKLAERCEGAEGPDRELDLEIARMMGVTVMRRNYQDTANEEYTHWHYTASVDAALTLVPEGMLVALEIGESTRAAVGNDVEAGFLGYAATAPTPALALCAASLRARSASDE